MMSKYKLYVGYSIINTIINTGDII